MNSIFSLKNIDKELFVMLPISGLRSGSISVMWISLPFLMLQINLPLALLGVLETVGILSGYILRIPAKFYVERNGRELATILGLIALGVSFSMLYLMSGFASLAASVFLISAFSALINVGLKSKMDEKFPKSGSIKPSPFSFASVIGSFFGLSLVAIYGGISVRPVYAVVSILLLLSGILSMPILLFNRSPKTYKKTTRITLNFLRKPLEALENINKISKREFLVTVSITQLVIALSIGSISVFFPALAIADGLQRNEIFLLFALVVISSFLISYIGRFLISGFLNKWFFASKPFFVIVPLLLLSITKSSVIFIVGYALTVMWAFVEPGYSAYISNRFRPEERSGVNSLIALFTGPIMIVSPLLGSLLWGISPRLLFAFAILPASVAMLMTTVSIGSLRISNPHL